jgi:hypothetical protein
MENVKCVKCRNKATVSLRTLGSFCNRCFLEVIEKRVRKDMRINEWIKKDDRILLIDDNSKEAKVGEYLLKSIIKGLPVKITKKKSKLGKFDKIIIPWSLDREVEASLAGIFAKSPKNQRSKKEIRLLRNVLDREIEVFAKIKGFRYANKARPKLQIMADKLEEKYPGCKFSVLNSMKFVNEQNNYGFCSQRVINSKNN